MSDAKPKLMVTGASGMLGHVLCDQAVEKWSVLALYRRNIPQVPGVTPIQIDLTDRAALRHLMAEAAPKALIHAAAAAQVGVCEKDPERSARINVAVPLHLAQLCAEKKIAYLFTSTDLVFDGRQAPYNEQGVVNPVCVYGEQKAEAEELVRHCYPQALVCRLPLMFGLSPYAGQHFSMQMLQSIQQGRKVRLLTDEYRTPVDHHSAAQGILGLMGRAQGLLHLGGHTRISRYDLGRLVATLMGVTPDTIEPVTIDSLDLPVPRAPDCSLDSRKAHTLGYAPTSLSLSVEALVDQYGDISEG